METWEAQKRVVYRPRFGRPEAQEGAGKALIGLSAGRKKTGAGIRIFCKVCKNWLHFEEDERAYFCKVHPSKMGQILQC